MKNNIPEDNLLYSRVQEIIEICSIYRTLLPLFDSNIDQTQLSQPFIDFSNDNRIRELQNVRLSIEQAEKEFIRFYGIFINFNIFYEFSEPMKTIFGYFITRKNLTQHEIKRLTKLSLGAISQSVNKLIEYELITVIGKNDKGHKIYQLGSIRTIIFQRFLRDMQLIASRKTDFERYKKEIAEILLALDSYKIQRKAYDTIIGKFQFLISKIVDFIEILTIYEKMKVEITKKCLF